MAKKHSHLLKILWITLAALAVLLAGGFMLAAVSPAVGAYGAELMRKIFGNQAVAAAETTLFTFKDDVRSEAYRLGISHPTSPWQISQPLAATRMSPAAGGQVGVPQSTEIQPEGVWKPAEITPQGNLLGAGVWVPYLRDEAGNVVAYRTFLQPDPDRPYAITEVVAFDLEKTQLHFVLGYAEPYAPGVKKAGTGIIPSEDMKPGHLLAAFNGGFKYEHGRFGAMSEGYEAVKPVSGLGTIAIYKDGGLEMGEWGKDIQTETKMTAFRQNGPLVMKDGKINPMIYKPDAWGFTISGGTVTWRSGIAISADDKTLYYFAGSSLDITTLAQAMSAVHPQAAMQLDINDFWVHFTAFTTEEGKLTADALFPKEMRSDVARFLHPYQRDFFYVTER